MISFFNYLKDGFLYLFTLTDIFIWFFVIMFLMFFVRFIRRFIYG